MRRSPFAVALLGLVCVGMALTGCATGAESTQTPPAEPPAETTPPPTVEPLALGPAEMPPLLFDGDCEQALPATELSELVEVAMTLDPADDKFLANLGALECTWTGSDGREVRLTAVPRASVDGPVFPAEHETSFFGQCSYDGYTCAWQGGDDAVWIGADFTASGATQEDVNAWGDAIGAKVLADLAAAPAEPWTRDRTDWWALDCDQMAAAVGAQLGQQLTAQAMGWDADRPPLGYAIALTTAGRTGCWFDLGVGTMQVYPGEGGRPVEDGYEQVELGVPGITAYLLVSDGVGWRPMYVLTDGVNRLEFTPSGDAFTADQLAVAVAAAAASDFQP